MNIYRNINRLVEGYETKPPKGTETYLGPVIARIPNVLARNSGNMAWRKVDHPDVADRIGPIYLPPDFDDLISLLKELPLKKSGIEDASGNLNFIIAEAVNWIFDDVDAQKLYPEMWKDVPNVSEYSSTASNRIPDLVAKLESLLACKIDSDSRSFELRFPTDYCPIVWSFLVSPDADHIEASLVFRSLEVSRNLLNDLYLFCVYFGYVFAQVDAKLFDINIGAINLFVQDAHIIRFD